VTARDVARTDALAAWLRAVTDADDVRVVRFERIREMRHVPPADGRNETVTAAGRMAPAGKPAPVRLRRVIPACPEGGATDEERMTAAWPLTTRGLARPATIAIRIAP